jgi:hypothetical protein
VLCVRPKNENITRMTTLSQIKNDGPTHSIRYRQSGPQVRQNQIYLQFIYIMVPSGGALPELQEQGTHFYCIYVIKYSEIIIQEGYVGAMWSHLNVRKRRSSCRLSGVVQQQARKFIYYPRSVQFSTQENYIVAL